MEIPMAEKVLEMMEHLDDEGFGREDHSALLRYYEEKENVRI